MFRADYRGDTRCDTIMKYLCYYIESTDGKYIVTQSLGNKHVVPKNNSFKQPLVLRHRYQIEYTYRKAVFYGISKYGLTKEDFIIKEIEL
jgi:hypothetical protein